MTTIPTAAQITLITEESSRAEILEALSHCNEAAKRFVSRDNLGRENAHWARIHAFENYLLDLLEREVSTCPGEQPASAARQPSTAPPSTAGIEPASSPSSPETGTSPAPPSCV